MEVNMFDLYPDVLLLVLLLPSRVEVQQDTGHRLVTKIIDKAGWDAI